MSSRPPGTASQWSQRWKMDDWRDLPLKLKQRWWAETDYGALPPTEGLEADINAALRYFRGLP